MGTAIDLSLLIPLSSAFCLPSAPSLSWEHSSALLISEAVFVLSTASALCSLCPRYTVRDCEESVIHKRRFWPPGGTSSGAIGPMARSATNPWATLLIHEAGKRRSRFFADERSLYDGVRPWFIESSVASLCLAVSLLYFRFCCVHSFVGFTLQNGSTAPHVFSFLPFASPRTVGLALASAQMN